MKIISTYYYFYYNNIIMKCLNIVIKYVLILNILPNAIITVVYPKITETGSQNRKLEMHN